MPIPQYRAYRHSTSWYHALHTAIAYGGAIPRTAIARGSSCLRACYATPGTASARGQREGSARRRQRRAGPKSPPRRPDSTPGTIRSKTSLGRYRTSRRAGSACVLLGQFRTSHSTRGSIGSIKSLDRYRTSRRRSVALYCEVIPDIAKVVGRKVGRGATWLVPHANNALFKTPLRYDVSPGL
eukprot:1650151-Rhodomonas_salina.2